MECGRLNKKVFSYFLLGFLLLSMLAPVVFDNAGVVKAEDDWIYRRRIDINASPYISADVNAVPILIKFDSTNQSDMFGTGEDGDSIKFTSDEAGTTQLAHECVWYKDTNSGFYVKVNLDNDSQYTPIYFWYGTPAITGTESKTNVWTNGRAIYHLEESAGSTVLDSMGSYNGTPTSSPASITGVVSKGLDFDGSADYVTYVDTVLDGARTVLLWVKFDAVKNYSNNPQFMRATSSWTNNGGLGYVNVDNTNQHKWRFIQSDSVTSESANRTITTGRWYFHAGTIDASAGLKQYVDTTAGTLTEESSSAGTTSAIVNKTSGAYVRSGFIVDQWFDGKLDEIWVFTDAKSADWLNAVYQNTYTYSTFVTIDGAVDMGNSAPNKPTITRIGSVATNASNVDDEDASLDFLLTLKGYNSSDPDGDDQSFRWTIAYDYADLYTSPDYNMGWKNDNAGADINLSFTDDINKKNTLYFGLTAKDPDGETNSTFWKMTVINNAPTAVTLSTPADSSSTRDTTPTFTWSLASPEDADGDNVFYAVLVYDGEGNLDANSGYKDGNTTYTVAGALDVDDYEWKVVAYDKYNNSYYDKTNSSVRDLSIVTNSAPNIPTITSVGGVTDVNGTVFDENTGASVFLLNLKGYNSSDPDGDNMTHRWSWASSYSNLYSTPDGNSAWLDNPADINGSTITTALTKNAYWYIGLESKDDYAGAKSHSHWKVYLDNKAPTAGTLSAPADSSETYDTTPTFEWGVGSDDDGDTLTMQVKVYDASGNLDYNNTFGSGTSATPAGALDLGTYTWRVRYFDGYDYTNSSDWTVTIIENTIPNKPTITSIGNSNVNATIYDEDSGAGFQLTRKGYNSSDPDGDTQSFKWDVDDNSTFSSPEITVDSLSSGDINGTFTTVLTKNAYYWFRLGSIDPLGKNEYNYSSAFYMYLANRTPTAGSLSSPANASEVYTTTPEFIWGVGSDDDGDTLTMQVKVYDSEGNLDYNNTYGSNTSATPGSALDLGVYTWRVRYYDGYAYTNSTDYTLTIIENTKPNAPTITTIGGQNTNATIYDEDSGSGFQITLAGYNSSDYDHDNQTFKWEIDNDSDFSSVTVTIDSIDAPADINRSMTTIIPRNVEYYFRLGSIDPLGKNEYNYSATIFKMTVANRAPTAPVVTDPTTTTSDTTPAITWTNSSDLDGDTIQYRVEISNASGVVRQSAWGVSQPYTNSTALSLGEYNITVYSYDTYDQNTSAVELFEVVAPSPPSIPTLTYPENWSIRVLGTTHMNWTDSTDPEGDAFTYTLYIESQAMTGQYIVKTGLTTSDYNTGDLDLLECHTYRWKVKSVQTDDNSTLGYTDWSYFQVDCTDIYEIKIQSAFNSGTDKVDVIMWLEKNGQIMTDVSAPSLVMKDYANVTVTTLNAGSVYVDGIYRDAYTITGTEAGLYTLKGTLTYNEIVYYGVGVFDSNTKEIRDLIDALVVGSGADQYEVRTNGAYDKDSGRVEIVTWIQKNGIMMTGISDVTVVMKDDANTTVYTFNSGTVYSDGFYRETWTTTGLHGIYSLKTTLTYSGNTYYGGSYFDAGIMEIHDALTSMTVTIGVIQGHVDTLETNVNATYADVVTIKGYVGTPADTSANNTLFGYSQFLKDKWGSYTAEQIYNKVDDVYDLVVDINSTDIAYLRSTLDDLDTYVRTYAGVDIAVGSSYDFYNDQLEISIAYVHDGDIKSTTSCTTVLKDSDGTVLKTFTSADGADDIYRYAWNSSAVDYPTNGFTGAYTIIPSVVYNGDTFTTVSTFNAELPDLYGVTTYDDDLVPYMDSGYSVEATSVVAGSYLYVKGTGDGVTLPNLSSVSWTLWWEDSYSNVLATSTGTGAISSNTLRMPVTVPSGLNGVVHLRLYAYKTTYGHRMSEISGVSDDFTVTPLPIGSGLPRAMVNCEIRECPDTIDYGREIPLSLLFSRVMYVPDGKEPVAFDIKIKSGDAPVVANGYTLLVGKTPEATLVKVPTKSNVLKAGGVFTVEVSSDGTVLDTQQIAVQKGKVTDYGWLLDPLDFPEVGVIIIPVFGGVSVLHLLLCLIILLLLKAGDSKR